MFNPVRPTKAVQEALPGLKGLIIDFAVKPWIIIWSSLEGTARSSQITLRGWSLDSNLNSAT